MKKMIHLHFYFLLFILIFMLPNTAYAAISITSATLNGLSNVTVATNATITATLNVTTTNGTNWRSTSWSVGSGNVTCVNHTNHDGTGSYTETFSITAPNTAGTYSVSFVASSNNICTGTTNTYTRANAITVTSPEIDIRGNNISITDGDATPSSIDGTNFGNILVNEGFVSQIFTVYNTGTANLTLGSVSIGGTNASNFTVTSQPSTSVTPSSSTSFTIRFVPSAIGTRNATLSLSNNDSNENPYNFSIQGIGYLPTISIADTSLVEGNTSYSNMNFTVTISESANASVQYATTDGSATAGSDYNQTTGTLIFKTSDTNLTKTISVPISGDRIIENNETFTVSLSNEINATLATTSAIGTIINDDKSYCASNNLSTGFHVVNPFDDVNKSIEIFCYDQRDFIALPIKNSSNNFVFNNNILNSTNYYTEASSNGRHFQAIEINAYTLEVIVNSALRAPQTVNAPTSFQTMGSSFSNINLTGTPFRIDWDNTSISNCTEAKLRKAYYGQDVKINTLNYDNKAICNINNMKLKLLDDYRYLEYQNKEVLQKSCKTMAEAVPKSFLNPSTIKGHYWISPYNHDRTYGSTNMISDERPIVVYCWYQSDLNWVWTFSLAMDGKVTNKKSDLTNKQDTCSEFGLVPFVPNREDTFERVRAFLYDKKSEWVNYTGTIDEKIKTFNGSGSSYYLSTEQNSIIWPYGSFGIYFPTNGNSPQTWGAATNQPGWMSGSPMHNISSITKDYERLNNDENVDTRDYYSYGRYSSTDTIAATNEYAYKDTMGYKGWVSVLGASDLNKTNEWFISRSGAGNNFNSTTNYPYYEPNGNYTAEAWLNFLFDSNGRVRHNDDWGANYSYYDYMCMAEDNYDFYTPYDTTAGPFTVIEHGQTIYNGLPKGSLNTAIKTKIVNAPLHFDLVLWDNSLSVVDKDQNISAGLFLTELVKSSGTDTPTDRYYFGQINGKNATIATSNGYLYLDASKWKNSTNTIASAKKKMIFQFKYCQDDRLQWTDCWTSNGNTATCTSGCDPKKDRYCICKVAESDIFAVRPNNFNFSITGSSPYKAGIGYNTVITAQDFTNSNTVDYNENVPLTYEETKAGCLKGQYDSNLSSLTFDNGSITFPTLKYNEAGVVNVKIEETVGLEFAYADRNDTTDSERLITPYDVNLTYTPNHFSLTTSTFKNYKDGNFTYISNDLNMSSELNITVIAKALDNNTTRNYNSACYAKATDYNISYNTLTISPTNALTQIKFLETNTSTSGSSLINTKININDVNKTIFSTENNGTGKLNLKINFDRNNTRVVNPFKLTLRDINVTDTDTITGSSDINQSALFYYGRVYSTDYEGPKEGIPTTIRYEVYCNGCVQADFNITGAQSPFSLNWYQNMLHASTVLGSVFQFTKIGTTTIANSNLSTIDANGSDTTHTLTNATAPYTDRIRMQPSTWLVFNPFNTNATTNDFNVKFITQGNWAGQGSLGRTVDVNASTRTNRKMEW